MINIYGKGGHANVINSILWNTHPKQINFGMMKVITMTLQVIG